MKVGYIPVTAAPVLARLDRQLGWDGTARCRRRRRAPGSLPLPAGTSQPRVRAHGSIASWGYDIFGQVSQTPRDTGYTAVAAGDFHCLALKADGSIASWGNDMFGQVSQTPAGTGFTAVAAGYDSQPRAEGRRLDRQLGPQRNGQVSQTPAGPGYTAVAAGDGHSLALQGRRLDRQLGS